MRLSAVALAAMISAAGTQATAAQAPNPTAPAKGDRRHDWWRRGWHGGRRRRGSVDEASDTRGRDDARIHDGRDGDVLQNTDGSGRELES
jgi:hypothetical protein